MIKFSKMHGIGNDFVVIDAINQQVDLSRSQIKMIANRQIGVGCDQLLMVESSNKSGIDFRYRIFNADGSEAKQCGNGARCFAHFVRDKDLTAKENISVETISGDISLEIQPDGQVRVEMSIPSFEPSDLPFRAEKKENKYQLALPDGQDIDLAIVSMGNPHAVIHTDKVEAIDLAMIGEGISQHEKFPEGVNVGVMQIIDKQNIKLRVYERGVGETLACGTGACAAVVIGIKQGLLSNTVNVILAGGELTIVWPDEKSPVFMTGGATHVFDGELSWAMMKNH